MSASPLPLLDAARAGLDQCVHCGFCLPACPTYLALEDENDSPRGRLLLMGALLDGTVRPDDPQVGTHLDQCLGCRGCETACPSGVPYGALLEATRASLVPHRPLPWVARLVLAVFAREWLLRPALVAARVMRGSGLAAWFAARLPARMAMPLAMLASTARPASPRWSPRGDGARGTAAVLTGCVMEGLFTDVNRATERTLVHNGWRLQDAPGQRCCGALHAHAGDRATAQTLARENIAAFERSGAEVIVLNSAGCGAMCKEYGHLLHDDPAWAARAVAFSAKVRDVHELLAAAGPIATDAVARGEGPTAGVPRVAYDAPCHLQHAQRVVAPPQAVLRACTHVTLVPLADSDQCCGSAGIYNLTQPEMAGQLLERKVRHIRSTGASIVATANPGCLLQVINGCRAAGVDVRVAHPITLLAEAYRRSGDSPS